MSATDAEHLLDNPIWHALTTAHAHLAEGDGLARRYPMTVTPLAGMIEQGTAAYASLAAALRGQSHAAVFLDSAPVPPRGWELHRAQLITQMVWRGDGATATEARITVLGSADIQEMTALARLTEPGPFGPRALELGSYVGIRSGEQLVAMAGERLHIAGYTEVSAVCTHPDHRRRGYSQMLVGAVVNNILARGETPILHVKTENRGAIQVYEKAAFRVRRQIHFGMLGPPASDNPRADSEQ